MEQSEFRVLIKHCFSMGKNTVQAQKWLEKCYPGSAPSKTTICRWYADFKRGRTDTNDAERSGRPTDATSPKNIEQIKKMLAEDSKASIRTMAKSIGISTSSVFAILQVLNNKPKPKPKRSNIKSDPNGSVQTHKNKKREPQSSSCLCDTCGKSFPDTDALSRHLSTHSDEKPHVCNICGKGFRVAYNLRCHENIHNGIKPYKCDQCPYRSACRSNVGKHKKYKHKKNVTSNIIGTMTEII